MDSVDKCAEVDNSDRSALERRRKPMPYGLRSAGSDLVPNTRHTEAVRERLLRAAAWLRRLPGAGVQSFVARGQRRLWNAGLVTIIVVIVGAAIGVAILTLLA